MSTETITPNKRLTIAEIKFLNKQAGQHTFDRGTLKFFGETAKNWSAGKLTDSGEGQYVYRKGGKAGSATFIFYFVTAEVKKVN